MFIGKYSKAFFVTSLGVVSAVIGMYYAMNDGLSKAILCLAISGICDMFDGKIARKENKTKEDSDYGIQIDSLADIFAFGVFPTVILMGMGLTEWYYFIIYVLYILGGITRLAFFNIAAEKNGPVKVFTGLPITAAAIGFPFFWLVNFIFGLSCLDIMFPVLMSMMAVFFVANVKVIKKPGKIMNMIFTLAALVLAIWMIFFK